MQQLDCNLSTHPRIPFCTEGSSVDLSQCSRAHALVSFFFFFFQAEDGIRDYKVTGVQTCALPISARRLGPRGPCDHDRGVARRAPLGGGRCRGVVALELAPPPVAGRGPLRLRGGRKSVV